MAFEWRMASKPSRKWCRHCDRKMQPGDTYRPCGWLVEPPGAVRLWEHQDCASRAEENRVPKSDEGKLSAKERAQDCRLPIRAKYNNSYAGAEKGEARFLVAGYSVERNDYIHVELTVEEAQGLAWNVLRFLGANSFPALACPTCLVTHKPVCTYCRSSPGEEGEDRAAEIRQLGLPRNPP